MIFTSYFREKVLIKRPYIKMEWIDFVMKNADKTKVVSGKNRVHYTAYIDEIGKDLRVVTLSDGRTVHNCYTLKE